MRTDTPITVYRKDYQPYPYDIPEVALAFDLAPDATEVRCTMPVSYTHLTLPTNSLCRSRWSPYH